MKLRYLATSAASVLAATSLAAATIIDFEGFTPGSVNNQGGWTVQDSFGDSKPGDPFDEAVVDDGTGNMVWRFSNAVATGGASDQPFSHTAPLVAGESGSSLWNDRGTDHTNPHNPPHFGANAETSWFYGAFDFRSATGEAQPGLSLGVSASAKQSPVRMTLLNLTDNGTDGINLGFWDYREQAFQFSTIATDLSYTDWHHIAMWIDFKDGIIDDNGDLSGNDIVRIYLDGNLIHTGTTWEGYYYQSELIDPNDPRLQAVDSLLFRAAGTAVVGNDGNGFYFDNVEVSNVPEPAALGLVGLAGLGLLRRRRRGA